MNFSFLGNPVSNSVFLFWRNEGRISFARSIPASPCSCTYRRDLETRPSDTFKDVAMVCCCKLAKCIKRASKSTIRDNSFFDASRPLKTSLIPVILSVWSSIGIPLRVKYLRAKSRKSWRENVNFVGDVGYRKTLNLYRFFQNLQLFQATLWFVLNIWDEEWTFERKRILKIGKL